MRAPLHPLGWGACFRQQCERQRALYIRNCISDREENLPLASWLANPSNTFKPSLTASCRITPSPPLSPGSFAFCAVAAVATLPAPMEETSSPPQLLLFLLSLPCRSLPSFVPPTPALPVAFPVRRSYPGKGVLVSEISGDDDNGYDE